MLLLLLAADSRERAAVCGVRHNSQNFMQWSGNKRTILCQSEHEGIPPRPKNTHIKDNFFIYGNSLYGPASWTHTKGDTSDMPSMQPTEHSRTSPPGSTGSEYMPRHPSCVCLPECSVSREMTTVLHDVRSRRLKIYWCWIREVEDQTGSDCELLILIN